MRPAREIACEFVHSMGWTCPLTDKAHSSVCNRLTEAIANARDEALAEAEKACACEPEHNSADELYNEGVRECRGAIAALRTPAPDREKP